MDYFQVSVEESARISPRASIAGNVRIGKDCTIFDNATIRGDYGSFITLGDKSNLQENCCIHVSDDAPVVIGWGVTIGHGAIIHGCTIGDETLIGMGSIIMDHACIGKHCVIGAGAVVTEGTVIPDGYMAYGVPAKPKRPLTEKEIQDICILAWQDYETIGVDMARQGLMYSGDSLRAHSGIALREPASLDTVNGRVCGSAI
ncbi:gamma carbonic anhydrase family protein [Gordonibacter sp. 28C]|uniref:gamma carbonic anhydrase family protein n=1 Tax=Gordonibacter sp. 28C TaxID=2078569 RepID=UPI000DF73D60|nr:gamma carbonic anhydrase family protein [Gordonibacter sp. 28C]RDB64433.1 gamma carbonic anhydrase family protein [Gordonibacter sp. 28C]